LGTPAGKRSYLLEETLGERDCACLKIITHIAKVMANTTNKGQYRHEIDETETAPGWLLKNKPFLKLVFVVVVVDDDDDDNGISRKRRFYLWSRPICPPSTVSYSPDLPIYE
jgi:aminopeptidase-like protein